MSNYFDFHLHCSSKQFLSNIDFDKKDSCWKTYDHIVGIIKSQASLEQMKYGNMKVAVNAVYTLEKVFSSSFLIKYIASNLTPLDEDLIAALPTTNYFDNLKEEIRFFEQFQNEDPTAGKSFKIIKNIAEMDPGHLNIILAIEGGHALGHALKNPMEALIELKQNQNYRFLYLTLAHFIQFGLCTQAFGMKMIKKSNTLKPKGFGLSQVAKEIIDRTYHQSDTEKRILIDMKHMSLVSRQQFYEYRKEKGYENIPILATHTGFTGISYHADALSNQILDQRATSNGSYVEVKYKERPRGIGKPSFLGVGGGKGATYFNPWSINLYNEEINIIFDSGGMIGIILDQRVLGTQKVKGEYFSKEELEYLLEDKIQIEEGEFEEDEPVVFESFDDKEEEDELSIFNKRRHLRHICNSILHAVRIGGARAWKQLCIGSDMDGLIDPVNNCTSVAQYDKLEKDLVNNAS